MESVLKITDEIFEEIVQIRRHLHAHPELSSFEEATSEFICSYLEDLGIPYQKGIAKTGVVGLLSCEGATETVLLRADMDALPVYEETGLSFSSENKGVMHACGHDGHMAIVLGCAKVLSQLKDRLCCNVKFVFQPAEETTGGALPMIEEGLLENPKVTLALGGHIMNDVPAGKVLVKGGEMMASPDDFLLTIYGKGGHGAYPELCVNPISIVTEVVALWNELSLSYKQEEINHVLTVTMIESGNCSNVIPDTARLQGTVRSFSDAFRQKISKEMQEIAEKTAEKYGAKADFVFNFSYPPLLNDEGLTQKVYDAAASILGKENVICGKKASMAGEDFAYFSKFVPSCYLYFGGGNEEKNIQMPLHSSDFTFDELALKTGVQVLSNFILECMKA